MEYNELMQGFADEVGVAELEIQDGAAALAIDGMTVGFVGDEAAGAITVVVEIGNPALDAEGPLGSAMLKANYLFGGTGGAVLCQNPETGAYAVMRSYPLVSLDVETFAGAVETLLNTAERWKGMLSGAGGAEGEDEAGKKEPDEPPSAAGFPMGGFMQV